MVDADYSCLEYWRRRYRADEPKLRFRARTSRDYETWQLEFRKKFLQCLGRMPDMAVSLNALTTEVVETEQFIRKKVIYNADEFSKIPAYLFIPKGVDYPYPR